MKIVISETPEIRWYISRILSYSQHAERSAIAWGFCFTFLLDDGSRSSVDFCEEDSERYPWAWGIKWAREATERGIHGNAQSFVISRVDLVQTIWAYVSKFRNLLAQEQLLKSESLEFAKHNGQVHGEM